MNEETARNIYEILQQECGATDSWLENFVFVETEGHCTEYRFCGMLGFGGKFWRSGGRWYVNCYREDETPERLEAMEKANMKLAVLKERCSEEF